MWEYFDFQTEGDLLLALQISHSFSASVFFKITKIKNDYYVYWRKGLNRRDLLALIWNEQIQVPELKKYSMDEAVHHPIMETQLLQMSPITKLRLNAHQVQAIELLMKNGLNENVAFSEGLDGHDYYLEIMKPQHIKRHCWCVLPKEWEQFGRVIEFLVEDIANLEKGLYSVSGYTE